jgi:hypothetical protein
MGDLKKGVGVALRVLSIAGNIATNAASTLVKADVIILIIIKFSFERV